MFLFAVPALVAAGIQAPAAGSGGLSVPTTGTVGGTGYFLSCRGTSSLPRTTPYYDGQNQLKTWDCGTGKRPHKGVDIQGGKLPGVTPVFAAAAGTVMEAKRTGGLGWYVALRHARDTGGSGRFVYTIYGHMGHCASGAGFVAPSLKAGVTVAAGQLLGYQGDDAGGSGCAAPVHLHWEVRASDSSVSNVFKATSASPDFYTGLALTAGGTTLAKSVKAPFSAPPGTPPSPGPSASPKPSSKPKPTATPKPTLGAPPAPGPSIAPSASPILSRPGRTIGRGQRVRRPGRRA